MECNRDEAKRAKEIAESKFSNKDVRGAKKFAIKAQSLYPELEGISQLLAILDVYVAAENKINGELDFYGILGVSPLADDDSVRKSYRKLALSLHPDKNKSIGAEGAFKHVSEAWNFLSDKDKRSVYDHKMNMNGRVFNKVHIQNGGSRAPMPPVRNGFHNFTKSTASRAKVTTTKIKDTTTKPKDTTTKAKDTTNSPKNNISAKTTTKTGPTSVPSSSKPKTFWTICTRCKLQFEFVRIYLNRNLVCPTCHGPFQAIETPPPNTNGSSQTMSNPETCKTTGVGVSSQWGPFSKTTASPAQAATMVQQAYERVKRDREEAQAATKKEEALRRKIARKEAKLSSKQIKSVKMKQDANKETEPIEVKKDVSKKQLINRATMEIKKKLDEWSSETVKDSLPNGDSETEPPLMTDVPDPDFHDFDLDRTEKSFEQGQVWAAYDDHDEMPRSYAVIRKVISVDPFKMKVCWLNPIHSNKLGRSPRLLEAYGEFKVGKHETVSAPNYFSHKANFIKQENGNIRVFPRKGDVCALYRNDQTSSLEKQQYEIVEVDEYDEEIGTTVTPLVKVAGFKTVFHRHLDPKETRVVLEKERSRFSHQIPLYLLTGKESPNAPKGCHELDPAAVPPEFLQVTENIMGNDQMLDIDCGLADIKEADKMDVEEEEECSMY